MRPSRVLHKLRNGETAICTKLNLADSRIAEIASLAGFDCVWTDMEHVPNDLSVVERIVLATKAYGVDSLIRVPRGSYSDLIRPLEMDATAIMVPHVMSLADAKAIVRHTKFHPVGLRPLDGGNADGAFGNLDFQEYLRRANEDRFVVLQIEDPEPLEELDAIAALEGVDMLFFGPGDFSQAIGAPGQMDHPRIRETRERIAEACAKHGKLAGTVGDAASLPELNRMGYRFVSIGADVVGLSNYYKQLLGAANRPAFEGRDASYGY
ncbi:HpcH/HpaI aldolase family protein [Paenibacillus sp.]|uniref:HpcH/HpaI aldolase family protein n=1 Tax=Paenibacillus sp. TaxID=58172 RepID=UPI002D3E1F6B|nr:aldolase/citrate lyase family protein [Paenibacillus sp.]HZG55025.1 aldolase/citrate lyase family protein [Paenibacillus sp.]